MSQLIAIALSVLSISAFAAGPVNNEARAVVVLQSQELANAKSADALLNSMTLERISFQDEKVFLTYSAGGAPCTVVALTAVNDGGDLGIADLKTACAVH